MEDTNFKVIVLVVLGLMLGMMASHVYAAERWYGFAGIGTSELERHPYVGHWWLDHKPHGEEGRNAYWHLGAGFKLAPWVSIEGAFHDLGDFNGFAVLSPQTDETYAVTDMCRHTCEPWYTYLQHSSTHALTVSGLFNPWRGLLLRAGYAYYRTDWEVKVKDPHETCCRMESRETGFAPMWGIGWNISERFAIEYQRFDDVGGHSSFIEGAETFSLRVKW